MLAQRRGVQEERRRSERQAREKTETSAPAAEVPKNRGKLSFKQKFALENLPKDIAKAEAEVAAREKRMADPDLFTKDPAAFTALASELEALRKRLAEMEEEWLELEMLREELEG